MIQLKKFSIEDIRSWSPCYDPSRHLPKEWSGTALDIASNTTIPFSDVCWVICRESIIPDGLARRFAAWCAAESLFLIKHTDKRSWDALKESIRFSQGNSTLEALSAARSAAESAAWSAAWSAAESAARSAAWSAARSAALSAARSAALSAARSAAESAQRTKLISMLREESDFTLSDVLNNYPIKQDG